MERLTLGKMQNPVRGILHGVAAAAASVGLVFLLARSWGRPSLALGAGGFGVALVAMFTTSALYHSVPWGERAKALMQRLDHALIFMVVAATFTPVALVALDGAARTVALAVTWAVAAVGVALKLALRRPATGLSVTLQMAMGWSALVWLPWLVRNLGPGPVALILAGGACYTAGTVLFATRRPRLFPRVFGYHEAFHVLVVAGAALHYAAVAGVVG